ncbi:MAG: hypothetical protein RLZZ303_1272 [Candidatus Hydrogenedentota bacterium]
MEASAHLRWYANAFIAQRTHYLIATNAASLYSVVWFGRGITDDSSFVQHFLQRLGDQMADDGFRLIFERCIAPHVGGVDLLKTADRSALGSMNDMVQACKFTLQAKNLSPAELSQRLNETPYKALGFSYPKEAILKLQVKAVG